MYGTWFLGRRVRVLPTAGTEQGRLHAGEYGEIEHQVGSLEEGVREYTVRLDGGETISLKPDEVEILHY
jgi:hypothetical protein